MAWNEPKDDKEKKNDDERPEEHNPWQRPDSSNKNDGPPDLDEVFKDLKNKLSNAFGGGGRNNNNGSSHNNSGGGDGKKTPSLNNKNYLWLLLLPIAIWLASGFYTVQEGNRGVVLQFGRYIETTNPGLRYHLPSPIQTVESVNTQGIRIAEIGYRGGTTNNRDVPGESLMLTADENIVDMKLSVQYRVSDPQAYLFNVDRPDETLFSVVESITREVVGANNMDFILTEGRTEIINEIESKAQQIINKDYNTGLTITDVNLLDVQPPEAVQEAFNDAIRAREDEQRSINQAEAYRNDILPRARGNAAQILEQATAYRERKVAEAEGQASRFSALLTEYEKAPAVTRKRLYLETMEEVMGKSRKVLLAENGGNLTMLPLQSMLGGNAGNVANNTTQVPYSQNSTNSTNRSASQTNNRSSNNNASDNATSNSSGSRTRER